MRLNSILKLQFGAHHSGKSQKSTKINFWGPEIAGLGWSLPREWWGSKKFMPSLQGLFSLGFEDGNLRCPKKFASTSRTLFGVLLFTCHSPLYARKEKTMPIIKILFQKTCHKIRYGPLMICPRRRRTHDTKIPSGKSCHTYGHGPLKDLCCRQIEEVAGESDAMSEFKLKAFTVPLRLQAKGSKSRDMMAMTICDSSRESQFTSDLRGWGEEPSHLRVVPRATFLRRLVSGDSVSYVAHLCLGLVSGRYSMVSALTPAVLFGNPRTAKCWDRTLGVVALYSLCVRYCISGGSRGGGLFGTLGATVPLDDSSRVQGGPWAPPPCNDHSPGTL